MRISRNHFMSVSYVYVGLLLISPCKGNFDIRACLSTLIVIGFLISGESISCMTCMDCGVSPVIHHCDDNVTQCVTLVVAGRFILWL